MKKMISLLMIAAVALSLFGCSKEPAAQTTEPSVTETTAATTEATVMLIDTEDKLRSALETTSEVVLDASLELEKTVVMHAGTFDGQGNTLIGPAYVEGSVDTENGVAIQSGTLKNITIKDAYRCLGDTENTPVMGDVRLINVTVDGSTYALNIGHVSADSRLDAEDCHFYGWSSFSKFSQVFFTDCTFGWDSTGSNGNLRPYVSTYLSGCKFEGKVEEDGSVTPFGIVLRDSIKGIEITLEDCYVGDTLITQENVEELLNIDMCGNELTILNLED